MSAVKKKVGPVFRKSFERVRKESNSGSRFVQTYKPHYSETGALDLVEDGKIDAYAQIQSFRESCDINTILKRFQNGDVSALNARLPYFADITEMPKTMAGFLQLYSEAENTFAQLPADIKSRFNNSVTEFFSSFNTPRFNQLMGDYIQASSVKANAPENTVKEVVSDDPQPE